jgi:hypothetical protein
MCQECIIKGGWDKTGAPKGVLMADRLIAAHVRRVKAEHAEPAAVTSNSPACTIVDSNVAPSSIAPSSVCVLADELERLTLSPLKTSHKGTGGKQASNKKHDRRAMRALDALNNIESRVQRGFRLLLDPGNLNDVGRELSLLRRAVESVSRRTKVVMVRKQAVITQIDDLAAQFSRHKPSDDVLVPIEINTGK